MVKSLVVMDDHEVRLRCRVPLRRPPGASALVPTEQAAGAQKAIAEDGLTELAEVRHGDYREIGETQFDAVSSIGLTEHIGVAHYPSYFQVLRSKSRTGGLLLNHCITRPHNRSAPATG